jgi:hypothetical protein
MPELRQNKPSRLIWAATILAGALTTASFLTDSASFNSSAAQRVVQGWAAPLQFNAFVIAAIPPR